MGSFCMKVPSSCMYVVSMLLKLLQIILKCHTVLCVVGVELLFLLLLGDLHEFLQSLEWFLFSQQ